MFTTRLLRRLASIALAFGLLIFAAAVGITRSSFHPGNATPVIGPMGERNRAFIENRSFGDMSFVLCVSDWPHTFAKPLSIDSVLYSEDETGRVFWSGDGSVVVVREGRDVPSWTYSAAYDFEDHTILRYDSARIAALLASRGGLGLEQDAYPDGKDSY